MDELVKAWEEYVKTIGDWQGLVKGIEPKSGGCGNVFELRNPIERPNESFAIADMRGMDFSEPHMHTHGETEVYFMLDGRGSMSVGSDVHELYPGATVVTPPNTAHCTYSLDKNIVLTVVNTPPFSAENVVALDDDKADEVRQLLRSHKL